MNRICLVLFFTAALVLFFRTGTASEKQARYEITVQGKNVGEFVVRQSAAHDSTFIHTYTNVSVKILFTFRVKLEQNSIHCAGRLCEYSIQTLKGEKINSDTQLWTQGTDYLLVKNGDSTLISDEISYSGSLFYFNEPRNVNEVFNERIGIMEVLQKTGEQTYSIIDKKGKKTNEYHYRDGILEKALLHHSLATVTLQRIECEELSTK